MNPKVTAPRLVTPRYLKKQLHLGKIPNLELYINQLIQEFNPKANNTTYLILTLIFMIEPHQTNMWVREDVIFSF